MKRLKRMFRGAIWMALWVPGVLAGAAQQEELKAELLRAIQYTCYSSFHCPDLQMWIQDRPVKFSFYHVCRSDREYFARYERAWGGRGGTAVFVRNPQGDFFWREARDGVIADTVIKSKLPMNAFSGVIALKVNLLASRPGKVIPRYSASEVAYGKIPCRKITVKYSAEPFAIAGLCGMSAAEFEAAGPEKQALWRKRTWLAFELVIGRGAFPFIYLYRCYNAL